MVTRKRGVSRSMDHAIPFEQCPAKTYLTPQGKITVGRSVLSHCQIVGEVARALIARYPVAIREHLFPKDAHLGCAAHDIGKVSPTFYEKILSACDVVDSALPRLPHVDPKIESGWGGHAGVSQLTLAHVNAPPYLAEVVGMHHGSPPSVSLMSATDATLGGAPWQQERERLIHALKTLLDADYPRLLSETQARALAGLTTVSDWIGSSEPFEDPTKPWEALIDQTIEKAGFITPTYKKDLSFEDVFGFAPRPAQSVFIQHASKAGVYVLEASMGVGKTEAALYAAYQLLSSEQATGIYFAMPTQLTSNKIHERVDAFLSRVLDPTCPHRPLLLHSQAWLMETEMGEEGGSSGSWFNQAKRGLLAPFAVGTVDQCLMAAMNVRHGFVRAFGLAGKVVILDEVHSYDAYTGTILDSTVALLRELGCTVIILSATLHKERRQALIGATTLSSDAYPLITAYPNDGAISEVSVASNENKDYEVRLLSLETTAIEEVVLRAEQGQQVIWIENTVKDAQERYLDMAARASELGIDCGLLHSRFTPDDRQRIEAKWVTAFGKSGESKRAERGRILIGTQVLEQSLDIDADFMVSRFAPTDLLLQRMGRLWRHDSTVRPTGAAPEFWVLAPELDFAITDPKKAFGSSAFVYNSYVLCRSLEVWQSVSQVSLPSALRSLIEQTYESRDEIEPMSHWKHELDHGERYRLGRIALKQLAFSSVAAKGKALAESNAQTRYSSADSQDVLLLRRIDLNLTTHSSTLYLLNGDTLTLPWRRGALTYRQWREASVRLRRDVIALHPKDTPLPLPINTLKKIGLHHCFYLGDPLKGDALLRVALVKQTNQLTGFLDAPLHQTSQLEYRDDLGFRARPI